MHLRTGFAGDFHGGMGFFSLLQHPNWETGYMHLSMGF